MIRLSHTQAETLRTLARTLDESGPEVFTKPPCANARTMARLYNLGLARLRVTSFGDYIGSLTEAGRALVVTSEITVGKGKVTIYEVDAAQAVVR